MPSTQSRESLRPMAGAIQSLTLPTWSMVAVIAYLLAFILNIASSGNDSDLAYAVDRDPYFHSKPLSDEFRSRLVSWRAVNTVKCICLLVAWISVCWLLLQEKFASLNFEILHNAFMCLGLPQACLKLCLCRWFLSGSPEHWHALRSRLPRRVPQVVQAMFKIVIPGLIKLLTTHSAE